MGSLKRSTALLNDVTPPPPSFARNLYFCSKYHPWGTPSNMRVPKAESRDHRESGLLFVLRAAILKHTNHIRRFHKLPHDAVFCCLRIVFTTIGEGPMAAWV